MTTASKSPTTHTHHTRGMTLMLVSAACFTATVLLVRALGEMHAANIWLVSCARFVVGLGLIVSVYHAKFEPAHLLHNRRLLVRGVVGGFGVYLTYLTVVKIGAGRATFIGNTYVIWGALLAAWVLRERLRPAVIAGSFAALAGLALLTNIFGSSARPGVFDLLAVVAAFLSAWVVVVIRQLHLTEHTSTIFAAQCVYGLMICAVPAIATFAPISAAAWLVIGLASLAAGVGQLTMTRAFRDLPVAEGSLLQMLVPLGVTIGGATFFHEHFTLREIMGAALIIAASLFTALHGSASPWAFLRRVRRAAVAR